jgi:Ca-activated chloride channel family protein
MSELHFLRPEWLWLLVPAIGISWWLWRATGEPDPGRGLIDPRLLPYLTLGGNDRGHWLPWGLCVVAVVVSIVALGGPTWTHEPAPFAADENVIVVILKVTPSMQAQDLQPSRAARAVQKLHDLCASGSGAKVALIAYAGSAHEVMPATKDTQVVEGFAAELSPVVMPREGDEPIKALELAAQSIHAAHEPGRIVWLADACPAEQLPLLEAFARKQKIPTTVWAISAAGQEQTSLAQAAKALQASFIPATADQADAQQIAAQTSYSLGGDSSTRRWRDEGYWLTPFVACLVLCWFRRGWTIVRRANT